MSLGLSYQFDQIDPVGGTPERLGIMPIPTYISDDYDDDHDDDDHADTYPDRIGTQNKDTVDVLL